MEQDLLRPLIVTLIAGLFIAGICGTLLFFVFRAVATGRTGERRYIVLAAALLAFVFICCGVFFFLSLR